MIQLTECGCGCSLRIGSLVLLWISLVLNALGILFYVTVICYSSELNQNGSIFSFILLFLVEHDPTLYLQLFSLISCITGLIITLLGICGMQKEKFIFISVYFYYLIYELCHFSFIFLVIILHPEMYKDVSILGAIFPMKQTDGRNPPYFFPLISKDIFIIGSYCYSALIIRSFQNSVKQEMNVYNKETPMNYYSTNEIIEYI